MIYTKKLEKYNRNKYNLSVYYKDFSFKRKVEEQYSE